MMQMTTLLAFITAMGGLEAVKWAIRFITCRKTDARKEQASVVSLEEENRRKKVDWLEERLMQRDEKIDGLYDELHKEQAEKLGWMIRCHEVVYEKSRHNHCTLLGNESLAGLYSCRYRPVASRARRLLFVLLAVCGLSLALSACGSGKVLGSSRSTLDSTGVLTDVGSWVGQSASSQSVDEQVVEHIEETVLMFAGDSIMGLSRAAGRLEKRVIDRNVKKGAEQRILQYGESRDSVASFHRSTIGNETVTEKGNHFAVSTWILVVFFLCLLGGGGYVYYKRF